MYVAMHGPHTQVTLRDLCGSLDLLSAKTGPPNIGYHGEDGYCRNTPDLRGRQSTRTPPSYFTEEISKQTISSGYIKTIPSDKTRLKYTTVKCL